MVFECPDKNIPALISTIEKKIRQTYGFEAAVFIRTKDEFKKLIDSTPFSKKDAGKLHVTFLSETPARLLIEEINKGKAADEEFHISNREIYLYCPDGYGRSKLSNNFFERKLKVSATTRNWRTANELFKTLQDNKKRRAGTSLSSTLKPAYQDVESKKSAVNGVAVTPPFQSPIRVV